MAQHLCLIIIVSTLAMYLLLDGRALAMCMLLPFMSKNSKIHVYNFILPSWDANQTWLVFSLAALYGAYSHFFGEFFASHYLSLVTMLLCFLFRGAAIEFSLKEKRRKWLWHGILALSSSIILAIQCYLVIAILLQQEQWLLVFTTKPVYLISFYLLAGSVLILFHLAHALDSLPKQLTHRAKYRLMLILALGFSSCILWFDRLTNYNLLNQWYSHLISLGLIFCVAYWLHRCFNKQCLRCFLYTLCLASLGAVYYYLYPFKSSDGSSLLSQASAPITVDIIAIASVICLPCLFITMKLLNQAFHTNTEQDAIDY